MVRKKVRLSKDTKQIKVSKYFGKTKKYNKAKRFP